MFIINIILICWLLTHYFLSLKCKIKNKTTIPVRLYWLLPKWQCQEQQEILYAGHVNAGLSDVFFFNICTPDM